MWIFYDFIFLVFAIIYLPIYLCKRKFHRGFGMRLGILPKNLALNRPVWIHAVSVGEMMAAKNLIQGLRAGYPGRQFFITTVTPTGNKIAAGTAGSSDCVSYLPLDLSFIVASVIERVKPSLFILMETEIWPNLITQLYKKGIPVILLNGRISDHSFRGYGLIKFLLRPLLKKISLFCVQTKVDAERFIRLGASEERIKISGNMKFDIADYGPGPTDILGDRLKLGLQDKEKLLIAASTHPGEEEIILDAYKRLSANSHCLRLLFAPRHPERAKEIEKVVSKLGFTAVFISVLSVQGCDEAKSPVFILDSIGQLMRYYSIADIVFVGGSLVRKGGHNILEPASLGRPVLFGPHMFNFRDISGLFLENNAAIMVCDPSELAGKLMALLNDFSQAQDLGRRAKALVLENRGATQRNLGFLQRYL